MKTLGTFLLALLIGIPRSLMGGYVFSRMWAWFIVEPFHLPGLSYLQACGVLIAVSFPLHHLESQAQEGKSASDMLVESLGILLVGYPIVLGAAYLWHLAIG